MNSQPCRILIVDDNEMDRDMLGRRLERNGYAVREAASARGLLESIQKEPVDLVLLDIEMPEISGLNALKKLRERYRAIELPIIMVTAKDRSEDVATALKLGANDYLKKPIDFPFALARISTQLLLKKADEALRQSKERYPSPPQGVNDDLAEQAGNLLMEKKPL